MMQGVATPSPWRTLLVVICCVLVTNFPVVFSLTTQEHLDKLSENMKKLTRQVLERQFAFEEFTRSTGDSGIRKMRLSKTGLKDYNNAAFTNENMAAAIHNHANNIRTVGMGEVQVTMNGVTFRTRHNDYRLYKPSSTSQTYGEVEEIEFPQVPAAVTDKATVEEQIDEMRLWFQAFKEQNYTVRDYRDYFKPVMCYMEGAWATQTDEIVEPFDSDRHFLKGRTWEELAEKVRFQAHSGGKDILENFAYLPTGIMGMEDDGTPIIAQWIFRIMCHEVTVDIPLNNFKVVDDLLHRMPTETEYADFADSSRGARFALTHKLGVKYPKRTRYSYTMGIDQIMQEIPGVNNYPANFEDLKGDNDPQPIKNLLKEGEDLNVGYYHRVYQMAVSDAMGLNKVNRGFNDHSIYMAKTDHSEIAPMSFQKCDDDGNNCETVSERWTYAIPLEVIFLTPLHRWNPHNIEYKGDLRTSDLAKTVFKHSDPDKPRRNGGLDVDSAFNGTHSKLYYRTPLPFFTGGEIQTDPADTTKGSVGVLDDGGVVRSCAASGVRIFHPDIFGVGVIRQRYPVFSNCEEGSSTWKEMRALSDITMEPETYKHLLRIPDSASDSTGSNGIVLELTTGVGGANMSSVGAHQHTISIKQTKYDALMNGDIVSAATSTNNAHQHNLRVSFVNGKFLIHKCDKVAACWDHHPKELMNSTSSAAKKDLQLKTLDLLLRDVLNGLH